MYDTLSTMSTGTMISILHTMILEVGDTSGMEWKVYLYLDLLMNLLEMRYVGNERENYINSSENTLQIYTVDPTGNFRHCVGGVATIGKNANFVKESIYNALKDGTNRKDSLDHDVQHNLDIVLKSILENVIDIDDISPSDIEKAKQFEAIVVFGNRQTKHKPYTCALLKNESILRSYKRCIKAIIKKHDTKI